MPELYANNLKNYGVRDDPEELIRTAQFGFQEIKGQMASIARQIADHRGWENGDLSYVLAELKKEQIPADKILEGYKSRLAAVEEMIREHDIITLPERSDRVKLSRVDGVHTICGVIKANIRAINHMECGVNRC